MARRQEIGRPPKPAPVRAQSLRELIHSPWFILPSALAIGAFITSQVMHPTPRYVKLIFGILVLGALARLPLHAALMFFMVVFPAPTFIFIGDTNVIFIGILLVFWIVERALGKVPRAVRTPIDWAILAYLAANVLSFFNVDTQAAMIEGLRNLTYLTAGTVLYFLLVNGIRTEAHLGTLLKALCFTALFVDVTAIYEYFTGGKILIPDWFLYRAGQSDPTGQRIGGIFGSHALLADFSAAMFYLQVVLAMRTRSVRARVGYLTLAFIGLWMIVLSVNRGGAVIWLAGGVLFFLFFRKVVRRKYAVLALGAALFVVVSAQLLTGRDLTDIGLVARLMGSQFVRGVPETRVFAWTNILARIQEHPLIGHGPFYDLRGGSRFGTLWPHSGYLWYLYTIGLFGLSTWLWMMGKLLWKSSLGWRTRLDRWPLSRWALVLVHIQILQFALAQIRSDHQRGNVYLYFMWILFAIAAISYRLFREDMATGGGRRPEAP